MKKYRKKPVVIEAVPVAELLQAARWSWSDLPPAILMVHDVGDLIFLDDAVLIRTLEGEMRGERDDWIIQGVHGELYPCKPAIFEATYEAV